MVRQISVYILDEQYDELQKSKNKSETVRKALDLYYKGEKEMKINEYGVKVRESRDEGKTAKGSYYHCTNCKYDNTDIQDVAEEVCWKCGEGDYLERRNFVI